MPATIPFAVNQIHAQDCISGMNSLGETQVDLVFADPPFNIGYEYDVYQDRRARDEYLEWSRAWMTGVFNCLKPNGTFWLAIGDEYAAELKVIAQEIGFHPRSWVIWYYTFGVNCQYKFSRSHAHLFYFVKNATDFVFRDQDLENRIPSARQLVYNDKRANPFGRLPDDTWMIPPVVENSEFNSEDAVAPVPRWDETTLQNLLAETPAQARPTWTLRPQDVESCFRPAEDTWYFPRVAGTFKERAGFHGCQMPEQLLGRIIRCCSEPGSLVLDPFSGSATTLVVAKKLGRSYLGFEISPEYVTHGQGRLQEVKVGDRLEGAAEPLLSAPKSDADKNKFSAEQKKKTASPPAWNDQAARERQYLESQLQLTLQGVKQAFCSTHQGNSVDVLLADPQLQAAFWNACAAQGLVGDEATWNILLLRLRKKGELSGLTERESASGSKRHAAWGAAAEMAWQSLINAGGPSSLDEIFSQPPLAAQFDAAALSLCPEAPLPAVRWEAFRLRKQAHRARGRGYVLLSAHGKTLSKRFSTPIPVADLPEAELPATPGLYLLNRKSTPIYAGETSHLRQTLTDFQYASAAQQKLLPNSLSVRFLELDWEKAGVLAWQSCLVQRFQPLLNSQELLVKES